MKYIQRSKKLLWLLTKFVFERTNWEHKRSLEDYIFGCKKTLIDQQEINLGNSLKI